MSDIDYGEVFGIEAGENETAAAEPSDAAETQGEKEQETAEPAETETDNTDETDVEEDKGQDKDENARFAAARRKAEAERDAAIAQAKMDAQRQIDEAFAQSGIQNPYTGKAITSKKEFDEYRKQFEEERKNKLLRKSGMTDEEFEQFVSNLPQVREAQAKEAQAAEAIKKAQEAEMRAAIDEQIKEIGQYDPAIKAVEDLPKMDNYQDFYGYVKRGLTFLEAYKLTNYDKITQQTASKVKRAALNAQQGKDHLSATTQRGAGAVTVPADIKAEYRQFNPEMTDAEIERHYNNYLKQKG